MSVQPIVAPTAVHKVASISSSFTLKAKTKPPPVKMTFIKPAGIKTEKKKDPAASSVFSSLPADDEVVVAKVSKLGSILNENLFDDVHVGVQESKGQEPEETNGDSLEAYMSNISAPVVEPTLATITFEDIMSGNVGGGDEGQTMEVEEQVDDDQYYEEFKAALKKQKEEAEEVGDMCIFVLLLFKN
jgi:hypothetical protein